MDTAPKDRDIVTVLGPVIGAASRADQPALIALAERVAAKRYRRWAVAVGGEAGVALRACAAREDDIATRVEALNARTGELQESFAAKHPDLEERYGTLFEKASLAEQFEIQVRAERTGADTWRNFANEASDPAVASVYRACAALEEESAAVLEELMGRAEIRNAS